MKEVHPKKYYPIFLDVEGKRCVIIGGGKVAYRKAKSLTEAGAKITIVSPEICGELKKLVEKHKIKVISKKFDEKDLKQAFLVIGTTSDPEINEQIYRAAAKRSILMNIVDRREYCNFIVPSFVRRGKLMIAISTSGASPALARKIRENLENLYGRGYDDFLELMTMAREKIIEEISNIKNRRKTFEALIEDGFLKKFLSKSKQEAKIFFKNKLKALIGRYKKKSAKKM